MSKLSKEDFLLMNTLHSDDYIWGSLNFVPAIYISFYLTDVVVQVFSPAGDLIHFSDVTAIIQQKTEMGLNLDVIIKEFVDLMKKDCENYNILDTRIGLHIIRLKALDDEFPVYDLNEPSVFYGVAIVETLVDHIKTDFDVSHTLIYPMKF
jgi:hypothetical protein